MRAYKSDGTCYRWWRADVESVTADQLVLVTQPGHHVEDRQRGGFISKYGIRTYIWPDVWYHLMEVYSANGELYEIYVNINSPIEMDGSALCFTDYELDISRKPPEPARLVDEDEFKEAIELYGYTKPFIAKCYQVAEEARSLADGWKIRGMQL